VTLVTDLPRTLLRSFDAEIKAASWFAALGEPLTDGNLAQARTYAGAVEVVGVTSWPEAEAFLKSPNASMPNLAESKPQMLPIRLGKSRAILGACRTSTPRAINIASSAKMPAKPLPGS